jgi:hypothetical protein
VVGGEFGQLESLNISLLGGPGEEILAIALPPEYVC